MSLLVAILFLSLLDVLLFVNVRRQIPEPIPLWPFLPGGGFVAYTKYYHENDNNDADV